MYAAVLLIFCSCNETVVHQVRKNNRVINGGNPDNTAGNKDHTAPKNDLIEKKYLEEGFIDNNTYRIVIICGLEECQKNRGDITSKAHKRAQASLQKLVSSKGAAINRNVNASILNLIQSKGSIELKDGECGKTNIFYFNIRESNLKSRIEEIARSK
jgi:hypothetical protein